MPSPVEEIKSRLSVSDVVGSYVRLIKAGVNFKANCPFHNEKTPSFFVSPSRDIWHCFGCSKGGDIFAFVKEIEGVEFPEALEILASRAGVVLKKSDPKMMTERKRLMALVEEASNYFQSEFKKRNDVRGYLKERGLEEKTIDSFYLGYAPQSWDKLFSHLTSKGYRGEEIERAGLAIRSQNPEARSRFYDRFRGRIMFPIADSSGRTVGFSGRIYEKDIPKGESEEKQGGKYINTPQTVLYDKSNILYLWDRAKTEIRKQNACILVEGQMDAILSHQAGVENTVAVSGTSLGSGHLSLIKRLASRLLLAFDTDAAGDVATKRGVDLAISSGLDVGIIEISGGKDPADLIKENLDLWVGAVREAKPVISFFLSNFSKKIKDARELKNKVGSDILPYVSLLRSEIDKAHWVQEISKVLGIREDPVWDELKKIRNNAKNEPAGEKETAVVPRTRKDLLEERILGIVAWRRSEFLEILDRKIREFFSRERHPLLECLIKGKFPAEAKNVKDKLEKLGLEAELLYSEMERVHEEFHTLISELEREHIKSRLGALASEIRVIEAGGRDKELKEKIEEFRELSKKLNSR